MNRLTVTILAACCALLVALPGLAAVQPTSSLQTVRPLSAVSRLVLAPIDLAAVAEEDAARELAGEPARFAVPERLEVTPETHGTWEDLPDPRFLLWRLVVEAPGALSLNAGFDEFRLPKGARLVIHPAGGTDLAREFTSLDNRPHRQLWTPVVLGPAMVIELTIPAESRHDYELRLAQVGKGYRFFGEDLGDKSGACNIDVVCPEGDSWRGEINSVAVYTLNGSWTCTGAMVNNTAENATPYFLTAYHCGINGTNDATMVVYWNFQSPTCGQHGGGSLADSQTGAVFRANYSTSDFCLVELEELPDPSWNVTYAGWDRTSADAPSAVAIHHPSTDEKSISFENDPTFTTSYLSNTVPGNGTHIRIVDWDLGTTEPGSSGSPLFDPDHHIVGQLHGGYAACGNDQSDWYGRVSVSWAGGGSAANRLSDWLDPLGQAPASLDLYDPNASGLSVTPYVGLASQGQPGGPFAPASLDYTLENRSAANLLFSVSADRPWISIAGGGGNLAPGGTTVVTVAIGAGAASLPAGLYAGTVSFTNLTNGDGDTVRPVTLQVGSVATVHSWTMDTDPGWTRQGQWAFGDPTGGGGEHGNPDPNAGYTGTNVLGYNLSGDYANNMPEYSLTTGAIDCTDLQAVSLRFRRYLNVEQPAYDHAYIRASADGSSWTTIWQNGSEVADSSWQLVEYDLSAIADGQPTVYVRWVMGTTDSSWLYSGWNLDDVEIRGLLAGQVATPESPAAATALHGAAPNPFNPATEIRFTLARAGAARLAVFDARGQLVRTLNDGSLPAGPQAIAWDGKDAAGRRAGSGVYFARLEADGAAWTTKLVMIK
ncbi:MAG TPA: FlgD immunoglobulin-like domain containing protein [Candidatus Krumholzibacteria bacterium]|nr:FlgD immunoglobulin-like domain containing protein [Candidatus Krumholzibacteria bacterium]HPD72581.1 FlgD immunoglobulin-like domain containing protein [Candidatus Krumholzibacteria bacterium]HRY40487.1 FlgD immunoglobulin-like domain containing protein [Candidatus Krumholzibacteria bacterium]